MLAAISTGEIAILVGVAFCAGGIDAIVGGGGLLQIPALLLTLHGYPTVTLLGTNKLASVWGTGSAAVVYNRKVRVDRKEAFSMAGLAFIGAVIGALIASRISTSALKPIIVVALLGVLMYVWRNPNVGAVTKEKVETAQRRRLTLVGGGTIGFYDGFIGPGTGSFLVFLLVGAVGLAFLEASAIAKVVNTATNLGAILWFGSHGHILLGLGLAMGAANLAGSQIGSRVAIAKGSTWVRKVFLVVVCALLTRLVYDIWTTWNS
jgi:uncharacterized protein